MPSPLFRNSNNRRQDEQQAAQQARSGSATSYGMRSIKSAVTAAVTKKLGDVGSLLSALFKPFGGSKSAVTEEIAAAVEQEMRSLGQPVSEPRSQLATARPPIQSIGGRPQVENDDWRNFPADEPILEGMYEVKSSNVHSIGYYHPTTHSGNGDLMVRFLAGKSGHRQGKGALYRYFDVPVSVWESFKKATSTGKAVWTDLRVLGTVSGHQYAYDLEGVGRNQRIPRQAGLKRGATGEFFLPRTLGNRRSTLPERQVRGPRGPLPGYNKPRGSRPVHDHKLNRVQLIDSQGRYRG